MKRKETSYQKMDWTGEKQFSFLSFMHLCYSFDGWDRMVNRTCIFSMGEKREKGVRDEEVDDMLGKERGSQCIVAHITRKMPAHLGSFEHPFPNEQPS
jgi:hypothetical protein